MKRNDSWGDGLMKTAIYLRKSRAEELSDTVDDTLRRHRETLLAYARSSGLTVTEIYEEVVSGENLYLRLQMLRLLSDVEAGKYEAVLCMDIDRLGRGAMSQQGVILETFKEAGTKIITPRRTYDLQNEQDEEYTEFQTFFARRELKTIKRRMRQGVTKTVQEGGYIANAPYGYEKCRAGKLPSLRVVEEEARFVRMIFTLYADRGCGCQAIADALTGLGAHPRRSAAFSRSTVMAILRNPVYTGKIVWNRCRFQRPDGKNDRHIRLKNPEESWIVTEGLHEAIIPEPLFARAQEIAGKRQHPPRRSGELKNPFAGLLTCARCGAKLQLRGEGSAARLLCPRAGCMPSIPYGTAEKALLDSVRPLFEGLPAKPPERPPDRGGALAAARRELSLVRSQQERLCTLLEQGVYTPELYRARSCALSKRAEAVSEALTRLRAGPDSRKKPAETVWDVYQAAAPGERNALLKAVISRVECRREREWSGAQLLLLVHMRV